MNISIHKVKAFAENPDGGNPAGVVLVDNNSLEKPSKQKIAAKVGYSETAFIEQLTKTEFKLEFFTPSKQIIHCGHATIASWQYN